MATAKRKTPVKKAPAKRKKSVSARSICRKVIVVPGINKRTGQLLKGWHYVKGKPVKVTPAPKKKATKKRGLGVTTGNCIKRNADGSGTIYPSSGGDNPCPRGGRMYVQAISMQPAGMAGAKKRKAPATAKQKAAQSKFAINSKKARAMVESGKAKTLKSAWSMIKS